MAPQKDILGGGWANEGPFAGRLAPWLPGIAWRLLLVRRPSASADNPVLRHHREDLHGDVAGASSEHPGYDCAARGRRPLRALRRAPGQTNTFTDTAPDLYWRGTTWLIAT
jgi:hypothetical protein